MEDRAQRKGRLPLKGMIKGQDVEVGVQKCEGAGTLGPEVEKDTLGTAHQGQTERKDLDIETMDHSVGALLVKTTEQVVTRPVGKAMTEVRGQEKKGELVLVPAKPVAAHLTIGQEDSCT